MTNKYQKLNVQNKKITLETSKEKDYMTYKDRPIKRTSDLAMEMLKTRKPGQRFSRLYEITDASPDFFTQQDSQ